MKVLTALQNYFGERLAAVYRAGFSDGSPLSDLDLIVVLTTDAEIPIKFSYPDVDIRKIFLVDEFKTKQIYLPYEGLECIFGQPIPPAAPAPQNAGFIKLGCAFFYAFQHNFYRYKKTSGYVREKLIHLNDVEYITKWVPEYEFFARELLLKIRDARARFPNISENEVDALCAKTLDVIWDFTGYFAEKIDVVWQLDDRREYTSMLPPRENTVFLDGGADLCKRTTEKHAWAAKQAKKIYLPLPFKMFLTAKSGSFAYEYARRNARGPNFGELGWFKYRIKMLF